MSATVRLPPDGAYRNFLLRALSHASSLGADTGECFKALYDANPLSPQAWSAAWSQQASRLDEHALSLLNSTPQQKLSAKQAYLRASNYHRTAFLPYFGHPVDQANIMPSYLAMRTSFSSAAKLFDPPLVPLEIPFRGFNLRGYLGNPPPATPPNGRLMILISGYDAPMEEMYHFVGHDALSRGYSFLIFDGPGQGGTLLEHDLKLSHSYDDVLSSILEVLKKHGNWKHIIVQGVSLGGLLCLQAVANPNNQPRIAALIADPGELSLLDAFRDRLPFPQGICDQLPEGPWWAVAILEFILGRMVAGTGMAAWVIRRGMLVHRCSTPLEYVRDLKEFDNKPIIGQIKIPTLITKAEDDPIAAQAEAVYQELTCEKKELMIFRQIEGAGDHCETGARMIFNEKVFLWLDTVL